MKKTTKWIATAATAAAIFFSVNAKAQTTDKGAWRLGIGVEGLAPVGGYLHRVSDIGLGGTARIQYGAGKDVAVTLTSGYYNFFGKSINNPSIADAKYPSFGLVPVKLGVKAFVSDGLYLSGEAGAGFETKDVYAATTTDGGKDTKLILSPGIGWANKTWDVGARYENFSGQSRNYGAVALRIAYGFAL